MALKVGELYASFGIDSSGLDSAISGIEKKCSSIAKGLAVTGAAMTATVTRSIVNAAKGVYESGTNFHAQMSKVGAIANATADDLETLTQKALEMGSTTSFTASEAGEAMEYMAMAGWKTGEMLDGIKPIMDLAAASGESLGTTSDIVTDALTAMGYSAKDAEHFANVMAAASTNANTNVSMMGESFKYIAPLAGTMGYSIDDLAVALGVMANSGIKASQAGTSLQRILNNMIKPTEKQEAAMKELGLSLYDSEGKTKSLMQIMEDMRATAKNNGVDMAALADDIAKLDAQLESGEISERQYMDQMTALTGVSQDFLSSVAELAGTRGLSGMLAIMNASDEDFYKLVEAIENCDGALDEMVAKMLDNAQGDMILFESAVDGLKISLWDLVEGPFRGIVQKGTGVVQMLQGLDSTTQMAAIKTAGLAAAAGPAMTALGGLVGMAGKLVPFLSAMASPLAVVGAGLGLFAVAAVDADNNIGKMLSNLSRSARKQLNKFDQTISKTMKDVSNRMPKLIESIVQSIHTLLPGIMNTAMLVIDGFMQTISSNASNLAEIGKEIITQIVNGVTRYAPHLIPDAVEMISNIATSLINNLPEYAHAAVELGKSLLTGLKNVKWSEVGLNLLRSVINAAKGIGGELWQLFLDAKESLKTMDWSEAGQKVSDAFKEAGKVIKQTVLGENYTEESTWGDVGAQLWEDLKKGFSEVADFAKLLVLGENYTPDATWGQVGETIWGAIKEKIGTGAELLAGLVLGEDYNPDDSFGTVCGKIWKKITDGIATGIGKAADLLAGLVLGDDYSPDDSFSNVCGKIWGKIKSAVSTGIGKGTELLAGLVLGDEYSPDDTFATVCGKIWTKIKTGIGTGIGKASELLVGLVLGDDYTADDSFASVCGKIWTKIKTGIATGIGAGKDLLGSLTLGDDYDPDASFGTVCAAIWTKIKTGIATGIGKGKELLSSLVLGEYNPDSSFGEVCGKIWDKIKTGISTGIGKGLELLSTLTLGEYTPDDSFGNVCSKIWTKIKTGISTGIGKGFELLATLTLGEYTPDTSFGDVVGAIWKKVKEKASDLIGKGGELLAKLTLGEDYQPGDSWQAAGGKIVESVRTGVEKAKDTAFSIAEDIIGWITEKLTTLGQEGSDFQWGDMGEILGSMIDSIVNSKINLQERFGGLAKKLLQGLIDFDWTGVGTLGSTVAEKLIGAIASGFHTLSGTAGDLIDSVGDVLGGKNGTSFIDSATAIAKSIVTSVAEALPGVLDDATSIVTKMGELLEKLPWTTMGADLGDLATTIASKATDAINKISTEGGFSNMVNAIGEGMVAAVDGITKAVGTFVGKIAGYLTSPDNLAKLAETGAKFAWEVIKGFFTSAYHLVDSLGTGLTNIIVGFSRGLLGVEVDPVIEAKQIEFSGLQFQMEEAGTVCGQYFIEAMNSNMIDSPSIDAAIAAWEKVVESGYADYFPQFQHLGAALNSGVAGSDEMIDLAAIVTDMLYGDNYVDLTGAIEKSGIDMGETFGASLPEGIRIGILNDRMVLVDAMGNILDEATDTLTNGYDLSKLSDFISGAWNTAIEASFGHIEDMNLKWDLAEMFSQMGFSASDIMQMDFSNIDLSELAEKIKTEGIEAAMAMIAGVNETIKDNPIEAGASVDATIDEATQAEITAQAEQTSNAIEAAFDSMPADIQADVAAAMTAMITVISDNQGPTEVACQAIVSTAEGILTSKAGHTIGSNFTSGMAAGINDGIGGIISAARRVANAAVAAFRAIWKERSPSRLARNDLAFNFDKGLELGLEDGIRGVATASRRVADTVRDQLYLSDSSRNTVYTGRQSAMETEQAIVRAAGSNVFRNSSDGGEQRMIHVTLELNGEAVAETFVPIVNDTMMADMKTNNWR